MCALDTNRTCALPLRRGLLYPLSYEGDATDFTRGRPLRRRGPARSKHARSRPYNVSSVRHTVSALPTAAAPPPVPVVRTLARLSQYLAPYRARFAIAGVALLVAAGCTLAVGQGLELVVDRRFSAGDAAELDRALFALLAIIAAMSVATYVRFYNVSWIGERVTADLRMRVFDHLLTLSPGFFEITRTGEVISRLTSATTMLESVIGSSLSMALRNIVLGVGALILLMLTSLKLTLLVLGGLPVVDRKSTR